jgi:hypothetical protein
MKTPAVILLVLCTTCLYAQVDDIKKASSRNSSRSNSGGSGGDYSSGSSGGSSFLFDFFFGNIVEVQSHKLSDRQRYPAITSLDVMFQGAVKPSSYYLFWPRIRGNWGLFSTDFRMNYLIEEGVEGDFKHIRTNDWQVIQLNLITSRFFTFRLGTGFMQETFGGEGMYSESALMMLVHAHDQTKVLGFEYRFSKDFETGANPRREFSVQYQHQLFERGILHGYATVGGVYQKYYNAIEVWGVQAGLVFRLF